jgi:hypothetical protein
MASSVSLRVRELLLELDELDELDELEELGDALLLELDETLLALDELLLELDRLGTLELLEPRLLELELLLGREELLLELGTGLLDRLEKELLELDA